MVIQDLHNVIEILCNLFEIFDHYNYIYRNSEQV